MNSETFAQFLKTPAYLYRISYQELKSLVVQYPYCQNLRYLLLKKSQADQHPDYERNLQMAATYSINRSFLYEQLYSSDSNPANRESNVALEEELLELKDLETLDLKPQKEVLLAETQTEPQEVETNFVPPIVPPATILDLPKSDILEGNVSSDELPDNLDASIDELFEDVTDNELGILEMEESKEAHQISETIEIEEDKEEILTDVISESSIDNLVITEEIEEEDFPEVFPEASSDDIEDLFNEDEVIPVLEDNSSLGLDTEVPLEEDLFPNTDAAAEDLLANVATGIGAVSIASVVAGSPDDDSIEEEAAPVIDLEIENTEVSPVSIDIADLSPVSQNNSIEEEDEFITETETELISPQSSFSNWLKQFNSPQISVEIEDLDEKNQKKKVNYTYELVNGEWKQIKTKIKKKKKKSKAELIAAESVKLSKDVATETLAQLLEKQEHYTKAIKMYERLRLENPEKSDYFASKIKTLQLKL
jgi:hypothetical protein